MRHRKTDYGTIILHWLLVAAFAVALLSGLRIATEGSDRGWINLFDILLPRDSAWLLHMQAAVVLVAVSAAYAIYLARSGLVRRVRLDGILLRGFFARKRLPTLNVILLWIFFVAVLVLIASGGLLYFGVYFSQDIAALHWYATWTTVGFAFIHVLTHYRIGGASQLLRIFRPTGLPARVARLDPVELLTLLAQQSQRSESGRAGRPLDMPTTQQPSPDQRTRTSQPPRKSVARSHTLQSNPFIVAAAVAVTGASALVAADRMAPDRLQIHRIASADAPILDGDTSDRAWRNIAPFSVTTREGGNFDGKGETRVEIRAVHDGTWAYFLFTWEDPTRSLKQLPLIKVAEGWRMLHDGYERGDEHGYSEDKFSVMLTASDATLAGGQTFHPGPHPIRNAPATMTGRGLHFTAGGYVDVWQWKATSTGTTGWMDDAHFGPPLEPTPMQVNNVVSYKGGFAPDPGAANYLDNFVVTDQAGAGSRVIAPLRLPKDLASTILSMGEVDLDPNHGENDGARWFMTDSESVPYSADLDASIPPRTVIPGVIVAGEFSGDRADVRCAARWASGRWSLEVARRLDTHSEYDVPIKTGIFMRVAAFDHNQIRHTRHVRPIRLELE